MKSRKMRVFGAILTLSGIAVGLFPGNMVSRVQAETTVETRSTEPNVPSVQQINEQLSNNSIEFEENRGQFDPRVRYRARAGGSTVFLTPTEAVYVLPMAASQEAETDGRDQTKAFALRMKFVGANPDSLSSGEAQVEHHTNYFKGSDASKWQTEVPNFGQVRFDNVYNGVSMVWHGSDNGEKMTQYDFVVEPNADPGQINLQFDGADKLEADTDGNLLIYTEAGVIKQTKPFTYQENRSIRAEVASGFVVEGNSLKFEVGEYDHSKTLTIDPTVNLSNMAFSTFLGGFGNDVGNSIAVDSAGNIYVTGSTTSEQFPTTAGTFDTSTNGANDVFVTKMNASGTDLIYSTFLGGSSIDQGLSIAVDSSDNAYLTGTATNGATDYPTTAGAFDTTHNGGVDAFVTKLNSSGSSLIYSTLIGGSANDQGSSIAIDPSGNAYLTGVTASGSPNFPTTAGAFDTSHNGTDDVFVTKLNSTGSTLIYSTFIGGISNDEGHSIAIDSSGSAYLTGSTAFVTIGTPFPLTAGSFDQTHNGGLDVFVTKLNSTGTALTYSTLIGGNLDDEGNGIAIDSSGNAYLTGETEDGTTDYPTTAGAFDVTHNGGSDVFVTKFNPAGSALTYSTLIGGSSTDVGNSITVDSSRNAYLTGKTFNSTTDYPTTAGAFDTTFNGNNDIFVTKLNSVGQALIYSTFIGGSSPDVGDGIAIDSSGNAYVTGSTVDGSPDYPATSLAFQPTYNGGSADAVVSKLGDFSISGRTVDTSGSPLANTAIGLSGDSDGFMLTDAQGFFSVSDTISGGNYLVSALGSLYNFNPANFEVANLTRNRRITFVGRPTTAGPSAAFSPLGGNVESVVGNSGLPNTTLTLFDPVNAANNRTVVTDSQGRYTFPSVQTGRTYVVFAQREGYDFTPSTRVMNFLSEDQGVNFSARPASPRPVQDFDGDGKTDLAVFRPSEGNWYIMQSQNNQMRVVHFGVEGDIPVAEDFDGDRRADIAVYRPSDSNWYRLNSSNGAFSAVHFGSADDKPLPADFDGDGSADIAVYRPSTGVWHRLNSSDGAYQSVQFGIATDLPVPADFDNDGKADLVSFRDGVWHRLSSSNGQYSTTQFGVAGDRPLAADFDGDGRVDIAVFRPSSGVWYWLDNADGDFHYRQFGLASDILVPADYNGDGRMEQAVYRGGTWFIGNPDGTMTTAQFGLSNDKPVRGLR